MKMAAKERERELENAHCEASQKELALIKLEAAAKREVEKATLLQAWEKDKKLHTVKKAIEQHHKAPAARSNLSSIVQSTVSETLGSPQASRVPKLQFGATLA